MKMEILQEILKTAGRIESVHTESLLLQAPFCDVAAQFSQQTGTVALLSGGDLDCARYHILGVMPWLTFKGRGREMEIVTDGKTHRINGDPLEILRCLMNHFRFDPAECEDPMYAGLLGYLAYDLKDALEPLPRTSVDDLKLPHICLFAPAALLVHDKVENRTRLHIPIRSTDTCATISDKSASVRRMVGKTPTGKSGLTGRAGRIESVFTRDSYMAAVERICEYIAAGDVYQVNMSQRFEADYCGDSYALFRKLYETNPAPFFAYIHAGDHWIVSTSPERFLKRDGSRVESRPIKGTRPRGETPLDDTQMRQALLESRKDDAELSMIVDLMRNDIGKVCKGGSVCVKAHRRIEAYENVWHSVSIVEGVLDTAYDSTDLIAAAFPGGSITGCPKIRAMEIIDELEPHRRHIYTGSIGYISFHDTMDLSIAIRTATVAHDKIYFSVGGGVVFDSDPGQEYEETLHKGRSLIRMIREDQHPYSIGRTERAWVNGALRPVDEITVSVRDQGLQYGYGFFETIRADCGRCALLEFHCKRFNRTWAALFGSDPPDLTWGEIIRQVIDANHLEKTTAAVKIIATMGPGRGPSDQHTLMVLTRPYIHRLTKKKKPGLDLGIYPEPRQTPLAAYKTLNYLYYLRAGKWAEENGYDEAIIQNPDGTISETNTANILLIKGRRVIKPLSEHVLPGVMQQAVLRELTKNGYEAVEEKVPVALIRDSDQMILTNSLMGAVNVLSVDSHLRFGVGIDTRNITRDIFSRSSG